MDKEVLEQIKNLSAKEILEVYALIEEHIKYLNESIIKEEDGEQDGQNQ
ncbi:MAG: hypothetical protein IJL76_02345 [Bacilli bacterium]|nr:hypothetical protein [Bacilli bacterium]